MVCHKRQLLALHLIGGEDVISALSGTHIPRIDGTLLAQMQAHAFCILAPEAVFISFRISSMSSSLVASLVAHRSWHEPPSRHIAMHSLPRWLNCRANLSCAAIHRHIPHLFYEYSLKKKKKGKKMKKKKIKLMRPPNRRARVDCDSSN